MLCRLQVTQHGACLGLGLAGLGSGDDEVFEDLKNVLYLDSAVAGEAAGLALGLLHVGTATEKAGEMLAYAHDTQHEKVPVHCRLHLQVLQLYCCDRSAVQHNKAWISWQPSCRKDLLRCVS